MLLCRIILENEMDCINPSPLCGVGHIGETPKNFLIIDLTPPSCGHSPYILRCKIPRKATGHGRGGVKGRSLLAESFFCLYTSSEIEEI